MSLARVVTLIGRDVRMGHRAPVMVWVLLMPVIFTFLVQVIGRSLFDQKPRLAIADLGSSEITRALDGREDIEVTRTPSRAALRRLVERHDVDGGLVLSSGFDEALRAGERPALELYVAGESLASNRLVLAVTALDLVRAVEDRPAPVEVALKNVGAARALPIEDLVVVGLVLFVLLITGVFAPAFMLVAEREQRTLAAILVTPATLTEVLCSKAALGFAVTMAMSLLTLALNGAFTAEPLALLATLGVATITCNQIGLLYATVAKDTKSLYSISKSLNVFLVGPLLFYFFPTWPQWIAKLFPTYWCIEALYQVALQGASLEEVRTELLIGLALALALTVPVVLLGRRLERRLAAA